MTDKKKLTPMQRAILVAFYSVPGYRPPTSGKNIDSYTQEEVLTEYKRCPAHVLASVTFETSHGDAFAEVKAALQASQRESLERRLQTYKNQVAEAEVTIKALKEQLARLDSVDADGKPFVGLSVMGAAKDINYMPF